MLYFEREERAKERKMRFVDETEIEEMKLSVCITARKVLSFFISLLCCFVSHKLKFYATASLNSVSPHVFYFLLLLH